MCSTADSLMVTQSVAMQMVLYIMKVQQFNAVHQSTVSVCCHNRRNSKYKQQTETDRQQVITNHTLKRTTLKIL